MSSATSTTTQRRLPISNNVEQELRTYEEELLKETDVRLPNVVHWIEHMAKQTFTKKERETHNTTLLVCGLTLAHDYFVEAALKGLGYRVKHLDIPDNEALRVGKEFGNRGQCNPTYFTVGNLVKYLCDLRDNHGLSVEEINQRYIFLTAGACGPCRFGMYVTEFRKSLREAGFDGFRVLLFQQTDGLKQATGEALGIQFNPAFFLTVLKAIVVGDVLNALGYRIRPYEIEVGATDKALTRIKDHVYQAFEQNKSVLWALRIARKELAQVKVNRLKVKPKVSIIGEFWAMTTEGDGNYQLQSFLEQEGAEVDIQVVTAWILYMIWEGKFDHLDRMQLRKADDSRKGHQQVGYWALSKRMVLLNLANTLLRVGFSTFAFAAGLKDYHLADLDDVAEAAHAHYNTNVRGGEGHMEVGKLVLNELHHKAHMTLSVKPFGCMPSAGVSDGVQSLVTEMFPGAIYCPVETSGDGRVNFYSRVQMYLYKAKKKAELEYDEALKQAQLSHEQVRTWLADHPSYQEALHHSTHRVAGTSADLVHEIAPQIKFTRWQRGQHRLVNAMESFKQAPAKLQSTIAQLPIFMANLTQRLRVDAAALHEAIQERL